MPLDSIGRRKPFLVMYPLDPPPQNCFRGYLRHLHSWQAMELAPTDYMLLFK